MLHLMKIYLQHLFIDWFIAYSPAPRSNITFSRLNYYLDTFIRVWHRHLYTVDDFNSTINISSDVIDPIINPVRYASNLLKCGESSIRLWKSQQTTRGSFERAPVSGRPSKSFPLWAHVSIRNIIAGKSVYRWISWYHYYRKILYNTI